MKRDHLLGFFQVNEFTAPTPVEKHRIHLARVSHALAREGKLRRAYSGGNAISAREKDKKETAKLEVPAWAKVNHGEKAGTAGIEKPSWDPMTEPSPGWSTGKPNLWGKFKVRISSGHHQMTITFYKGFWYGQGETARGGLKNPMIKAEESSARCSQDCWEWQIIPGEHYVLPNGTAVVETKPTFDEKGPGHA